MPDKSENCTCSYPKNILRNGSGHAEHCPVQLAWVAEMEKFVKEKTGDFLDDVSQVGGHGESGL